MEKFGFNTLLNSKYMKILEYFLPEQEKIKVAKNKNNEIYEIVAKYLNTFGGLVTIPLNCNINHSFEEAKRAIKDLGLNGS
jgi:hypothetical protein